LPAALRDGLVEGLFAAMQAGEGDADPLALQRRERNIELLEVSFAERGDGRPLGLNAVSICRVDGRLRNPQRYSGRMRVGLSIRIIRNEGEATHGPSCVGAMAQKFLPPLAASSRSLSVSKWRAALELTVVVGRTVGRMYPSSSKSFT